jgi:hypothetical protein
MSLATFELGQLAKFTPEGSFPLGDSPDFRAFYVGRDDVHGILVQLFTAVTLSAKLNMFGYDDDELNKLLMGLAENPRVVVQVTLDKSQSGGVHEKAILASDLAQDAEKFAASFVVGESATHQISHTKGGILDGVVAFEGSTNWSTSGEGTGIQLKGAQNAGWKAQNNTLTVYTNPTEIAKFSARLDYEHGVAVQQQLAAKSG